MNGDAASCEPREADRGLWMLAFRPDPSEVPVAQRVKQLLKQAGRDLGLMCVECLATPLPEQLAASWAEVVELEPEVDES